MRTTGVRRLTVIEKGKSQSLMRAYETLDRDELRDFLIKDMVASTKHHPIDDLIIDEITKKAKE